MQQAGGQRPYDDGGYQQEQGNGLATNSTEVCLHHYMKRNDRHKLSKQILYVSFLCVGYFEEMATYQ